MERTNDELLYEIEALTVDASGRVLLVEGDTDARLFKSLLSTESGFLVIPANGRSLVEQAILEFVNERGVRGLIGIVDADFDRCEGRRPISPALFFTDGHDLEIMMCHSPSFERVITEYSTTLIGRVADGDIGRFRSLILAAIQPIGLVRWWSCTKDDVFNESLKSFPLKKCFHKPHLKTTIETVCDVFVKHCHRFQSEKGMVSAELKSRNNRCDLRDVCHGHDLCDAICCSFSWHGVASVSRVEFSRSLRLAYSGDDFRQTALYVDIGSWATQNGMHNPFH